MSDGCSCHLSPPCAYCLSLTEEEVDDIVNAPSLTPIAGPTTYTAPPTPAPAYTIDESRNEYSGNKLRTMMRSGEIRVWSTWWGVDDGSAEAEAHDSLRRAVEKARAATPTPTEP